METDEPMETQVQSVGQIGNVTFVSGNTEASLAEVQAIFSGVACNLSRFKVDLADHDERFSIKHRCRAAARVVKGSVLVEEYQLHFHALKGLPGNLYFIERMSTYLYSLPLFF